MTNSITFSKVSNYVLVQVGLVAVAFMAFAIPFLTHAAVLNRQLDIGMSGSDVSALQLFLAKDPSLYPQGIVSGYFGALTSAAVANFQTRNGIASVGRVGPVTLAALNAQMGGGVSTGADIYAPVISSVGVNTTSSSASVSWNTSEFAKGVVYFSATPLTTYENPHTVDVSGNTAMTDSSLRTSQNVVLSGLQSATTYYYLIYVTDASGNVSITLPSTFRTQ
ncbi:MAG: peptidoglycan-binding protein [Patescibacteria group bacterium]